MGVELFMNTEEKYLQEWESLLRVPYGLLLVNADGVVMHISPIAGVILQNSREITLRNGELYAPQWPAQVKKLIHDLAAPQGAPFLLRFDRQSGRKPLFLLGVASQ